MRIGVARARISESGARQRRSSQTTPNRSWRDPPNRRLIATLTLRGSVAYWTLVQYPPETSSSWRWSKMLTGAHCASRARKGRLHVGFVVRAGLCAYVPVRDVCSPLVPLPHQRSRTARAQDGGAAVPG